jgi:methylmalonyl-CoA/ethylmalonyl-CoA epimerase
MGLIREVDHVAVAVESVEEAMVLFRDVLGGEYLAGGDDDTLGVRAVRVRLGGIRVELLQPLRDDSPIRRFLDRKGPGFHHMTMFVDDLDAAIQEIETSGFEVVDTDRSKPYWLETYIRPRSGFGTLLQVVQTTERWDQAVPEITMEDVLAGRSVWRDGRPYLRDLGPPEGGIGA